MLELGALAEVRRKGSWQAWFSVIGEDEVDKIYMRKSIKMYNDVVRAGLEWL